MKSIWAKLFIDYPEMDALNLTKKKTLLVGLLYMWIHFSITIFFVSTTPVHKTILSIAWVVNVFNIYLLCRKSGVLITVRLLTVAWLLNVTNTAWNTGGIYSTSMLWQVMFIFLLATYLDRKAALWATVYVIFTYVVFFYLQYSGIKNFKTEILKNPPYYELISVASLFVVIICALFFIFTEDNFNRTWKKEKEVKIDTLEVELNKKMQEIGVLRNKIARDFHDEMGNKLASIRLLSENLTIKSEKQILETEDLLDTLLIIQKNSKELFDGTKDFIWSVGSNSEKVVEFYEYVRDFAEKFLNDLDINLNSKFEIPDEKNLKIDPASSRQLIFVAKEIITNAAKHANAKQVNMFFEFLDNKLKITISDDGTGFDTQKPKSRGLKNIDYRLQRIKATYFSESSPKGTFFEIYFPISDSTTHFG